MDSRYWIEEVSSVVNVALGVGPGLARADEIELLISVAVCWWRVSTAVLNLVRSDCLKGLMNDVSLALV